MTAPPNRLPFQEQGAERKEESHDGRDGASNAHRKDGVKEDGDGSGGNSFNNLFSSSSVVAPLLAPGIRTWRITRRDSWSLRRRRHHIRHDDPC